jgi:predicted hotdog family 3-hydroxylacyl-ACP dehydratase
MSDLAHILPLIPQRPPFVMIDELLHWDQKSARSCLLVSRDNILVEHGRLSEAGLLENIAQTAAAGIGARSLMEDQPAPVGYIGAIQNLEIFELPAINEEIKTEISIKNQIFNVTVIEGTVRNQDKVLARCDMKIFISNLQ